MSTQKRKNAGAQCKKNKMSMSITKSLRVPKVSSEYAANAESERFQDPRFNVCPAWNGQDNLGRGVSYYSFDSLTAGCHSAEQRIDIENALRPDYHPYLNTEGIDAEDQQYGSSFGGRYDTFGLNRDQAYKTNARYGNVGPTGDIAAPMTPMQWAQQQEELVQKQRRGMRRKFETNRYSSGMLRPGQ